MASDGARARSLEDRTFRSWGLAVAGALLVAFYGLLLAIRLASGMWVNGDAPDFLVFWSAGSLALGGRAAAAFDWATLGTVELQAADKTLPWVYPPTFLLAVAPFALFPYGVAFVAWVSLTLSCFLAAIHAIVPRRLTLLLALAWPPVLWNVVYGQNGFLSAALLGSSLALLRTRPLVAGLLLGLLTYKPQFGVLFPVVLLLTGQWRVIGAAALSAVMLAAASYLAFGAETWAAFFDSGPATFDGEFGGKFFPLSHLQTTYGLVRWMGGGETVAWTAQAVVAIAAAGIVCRIWLSRVAYPLKAAALSAAALITTPYLLIQDLVAVAVPVAFLVRAGLASGFRRGERSALAAITVTPLVQLQTGLLPLAPIFLAVLMGLIVLRAGRQSRLDHRASAGGVGAISQ